jgi:hypothetical protein
MGLYRRFLLSDDNGIGNRGILFWVSGPVGLRKRGEWTRQQQKKKDPGIAADHTDLVFFSS